MSRALRRVADGVLDEVERHAVELVAGAVDDRVVGVDREVVAVGDRPELGRHLDEHAADVGRLVRELAVGVGAGQQQQVAHEAAHALRGAQGRARRLAALAVEDVGQQLEVGEDRGQRRAQLVRGVGHELALALQGALGLLLRRLQRVEHRLQRARELGHLVVGAPAGGSSSTGRACAGCRARPWSCARPGASRGARAGPRPAARAACRPGRRRRGRAARARMVASTSETLRPYWRTIRTTARLGRRSGVDAVTGRGGPRRAGRRCRALRVRVDEAEVRRARRLVEERAVGQQDADRRRCRRRVVVAGPGLAAPRAARRSCRRAMTRSERLSTAAASSLLKSERTRDDGDLADDHREAREDDQRQAGREQRQAPPDRDAAQARSTYPAPRMVCSSRASPPDSSLRRRLETKTSIVFVVANGS